MEKEAPLYGICHFCGERIFYPFVCDECGETFCPDHHLPPNHSCTGINNWLARPSPAAYRDIYTQVGHYVSVGTKLGQDTDTNEHRDWHRHYLQEAEILRQKKIDTLKESRISSGAGPGESPHSTESSHYTPARSGRRRGIFAALILLILCFTSYFLITHPNYLAIPNNAPVTPTYIQPAETPTLSVIDEIRARYGNKYNGYEYLIKRTPSGGFDTRDADAAISGLSSPQPTKTYTLATTKAAVRLTETPRSALDSIYGKPTIDIPSLETRIHQLVNDQRSNYGIGTLTFDTSLSSIARGHSQDMAIRNYFSHDSPEGLGPIERGLREGFSCSIRSGNYIYGMAENIFQNNLYDSITFVNGVPTSYDWNTQEEIASSTVDGWMESPGHRQNILLGVWRREGIGVAIATDGKVYITQDFC